MGCWRNLPIVLSLIFGDVRAFGWFYFEFFFHWFHDSVGSAHGGEANHLPKANGFPQLKLDKY